MGEKSLEELTDGLEMEVALHALRSLLFEFRTFYCFVFFFFWSMFVIGFHFQAIQINIKQVILFNINRVTQLTH